MKHAFMIMAHSEFDLLMRLLRRLDHEDNEIFVHIDKKAQPGEDVEADMLRTCQKSKVKLTARHCVNWGGVFSD